MPADHLLADLDDSQRAAVVSPAAPLAILAPAGSGKTRVLTRRIAWQAAEGNIKASHTLAVTFTRKAAGELRERLARLDVDGRVTAGTMHSLALAQLRRRAADRNRGFPKLLERKAPILGPLLGGRGARLAEAVTEIASEIEWAKARAIVPEVYAASATAAGRPLPRPAGELAEIYARYEAEKRRRSLLDFDDLLWWCAQALEDDAEFAASVRIRFRHLFVDEFQDVSPAQLRVIRAILGERNSLCAVGDDAQAIYGFAGADPGALTGFASRFPGATVLRLSTNYRSTPEIVAVSNAALGRESGIRRPMPRAVVESGAIPSVTGYADHDAEARGVVQRIQQAHARGVPYHAMAVLFRINSQSVAFEEAFTRAGIPVRLRDSAGFLQRTEVRAIIETMREREAHAPTRPFSDQVADLIQDRTEEDSVERRGYIEALVRLAEEYLELEQTGGSLNGFLAWARLATRGEDAGPGGGDSVDLLTFHRSKGLEWPVVFVVGVEQGYVPIHYAKTPEAKAEEARLLHVALSRAIEELHISWAEARGFGERTGNRKPSPWLAGLEHCVAELAGDVPEAVDPTPRARSARQALRSATRPAGARRADTDPELFEALRSWRLTVARANDIPAYVVLRDSTLADIAAEKPRSLGELAGISGIGPTKLERYGPDVLALVANHG